MRAEENGERIEDLKVILSKVAYAASLFDNDGIQVRLMNCTPKDMAHPPDPRQYNNIRTEEQVKALLDLHDFKGLTPMGTELRRKILDPLVVGPARAGALRKPVLVITITDGQPAGETGGTIFDTIRYVFNELQSTKYGPGAVSFQFAQVGNDLKAREFLAKLDKDPLVGGLVDCTSSKLSSQLEIYLC